MAFDDKLAVRVRRALSPYRNITERRMFGGLCFLINGHMVAGILASDLILRVGPDAHAAALARPHVRPFDFTGRPSSGMIYVGPPGIRTARSLTAWLTPVAERVAAMPAKGSKKDPRPAQRRASR